jgi:hypothetical protein
MFIIFTICLNTDNLNFLRECGYWFCRILKLKAETTEPSFIIINTGIYVANLYYFLY